MTDFTKFPGGKDFSHWNGPIDWAKEADEQPAFVILKATDGMGVDPMFDRNRKGAQDNKIRYLWYPFLEPGDNDVAISRALAIVGDRKVPPALDWEKAKVATRTVERWMALCESEARSGLVYHGLYPPDRVSPTVASWPLWYAQYPGSPTAPPHMPPWDCVSPPDWSKSWLIWQWSEKGRDPAAPSGPVDLDRLAVPLPMWNGWYDTGAPFAPDPALAQQLPPATPLHVGRIPVVFNMTGADVRRLQDALVAKGYGVGKGPPDGDFGPRTLASLKLFQQNSGLPPTGVADLATLTKLAA